MSDVDPSGSAKGASRAIDVAAVRRQFPVVEHCTFLNHAAMGPISRRVRDAVAEQCGDHLALGQHAVEGWRRRYERARLLAAGLVNSAPRRIAFTQNTSHGLSLAANGIDWRTGDNVVLAGCEFPSNFYPWLNLESQGVEVRTVAVDDNRPDAAHYAPCVDDRTRVVAVSAVQYLNGFRTDLAALATLCREHDALLVVDGTQALGAVGVDVEACGIDVLAVSAHKWLMGPFGIGFAAFSDRALERLDVRTVGWLSVEEPYAFRYRLDLLPDARRFEPGTENAHGIYGLCAALEQIEDVGSGAIESRVVALGDRVAGAVQTKGYTVDAPREPGGCSGIVTFRRSGIAASQVVADAEAAGIMVSARNGGIRVSAHYYNTEDEIDRLLEQIP